MRELRAAILVFLVLTVLTGLIYPLVVTGIAQAVFPHQANGSLIVRKGRPVGSVLIGQPFAGPRYFWSRPSATAPFPYNAASSGASNLGPTNQALIDRVKADVERVRAANPGNGPVPVDLVTASASGLDPHISPAAASYQVERVAAARGLAPADVRQLVALHTRGRWLGVIGEARVNVLELNLDLDRLSPRAVSAQRPRPGTLTPDPSPAPSHPPHRERGTRLERCCLSPSSPGVGGGEGAGEEGRGDEGLGWGPSQVGG